MNGLTWSDTPTDLQQSSAHNTVLYKGKRATGQIWRNQREKGCQNRLIGRRERRESVVCRTEEKVLQAGPAGQSEEHCIAAQNSSFWWRSYSAVVRENCFVSGVKKRKEKVGWRWLWRLHEMTESGWICSYTWQRTKSPPTSWHRKQRVKEEERCRERRRQRLKT